MQVTWEDLPANAAFLGVGNDVEKGSQCEKEMSLSGSRWSHWHCKLRFKNLNLNLISARKKQCKYSFLRYCTLPSFILYITVSTMLHRCKYDLLTSGR